MTDHKVGSREEWLAARLKLLEAEKAHTRRGDELTEMRKALPWVRIDKVFLAGVSADPVGAWVTQQARNLVLTLEDQGRAVPFLGTGPRRQVRRALRRGDEVGRRPGHPDTGAVAPGERVRRKVGAHSQNRVPRLA